VRASRRAREGAQDEAVTVVIGTILLAGLIVTTLVTIKLYYVPVWQENDEAAHMQVVSRQFASLKADLDHLVDNRTTVPLSTPMGLGQEKASVFSAGDANDLAHAFGLTVGNAPVNFSAQLLLVQAPMTGGAGLDESWQNVQGNQTVGSVMAIQSFRLRVHNLNSNSVNVGDQVNLTMTDGTGAFRGNFTVYAVEKNPDPTYNIRVCNKNGCDGANELYDQGITFHASQNNIADWIVDVMDPAYRFDRLIANASADAPLTFRLNQTGSPSLYGEYAITYTPVGGGGGGGGSPNAFVIFQNYTNAWPAGTLKLSTRTAHFPNQDLYLENGAVIVRQGDGAAMKVEPSFGARVVGNATYLSIGLPSLGGLSQSLAAQAVATVTASPGNHTDVIGQANRVTLNVTTAFPQLWVDYFTTKLTAAGLTAGTNFTAATVGNVASLTVYGVLSDPNSQLFDIVLTLRQADIAITI
jgi:hypothetical protein